MSTVLSRRRLMALFTTPVLVAGCSVPGMPGPSAPAQPTSVATAAATAVAPGGTRSSASATPATGGVTTPAPATAGALTPATSAQQRGGSITEGWLSEARTLNPLYATDVVSRHATQLLFSSLLRIDPTTYQPEGDLAEKWERGADGLTYRFTLRNGVAFHDGTPCTAEDVKFTYDLLRSERALTPHVLELSALIDAVTVLSPTSLEIRLREVFAPFLTTHTGYGIVPKHILGSLDASRIEQDEFSTQKPIGTGPYRFQEWVRGSHVRLGRYDGYFGGPAGLDEAILAVVANQDLLQEHLRSGRVDLGLVREHDVAALRQEQRLSVVTTDTLSIEYLGFQLDPERSPLFQERAVRRALALGLDRERLVREGRDGLGQVATGSVPPPSWGYSDRLKGQLTYDPAQAEQLLEGAGWVRGEDGIRTRDGKRLAFTVLTNQSAGGSPVRDRYLQIIGESWRRLGAEVTPLVVEFGEVLTRLRRSHEFDVYLAAFALGIDPDQRLLWHTDAYKNGFNASRYSNPDLDRIMTEAVHTVEHARREALYKTMQEILLEDVPAVVLAYPLAAYAINKRVRNLTPNAVSLAYNAHQWSVDNGA